jgi:putative NIF3 family GTP cyclohydrolase 1 type 2
MLWRLARAGISVYSPHTAWDNAPEGINQWLAQTLELTDVRPLRPFAGTDPSTTLGAGRFGRLPAPLTLDDLAQRSASALKVSSIEFVGDAGKEIRVLGIACGSAAEFWKDAQRQGCDALLTGETRFHGALEVRAAQFPLLLAGHYATERPGMEHLAKLLSAKCPNIEVWCSNVERDPVQRGS